MDNYAITKVAAVQAAPVFLNREATIDKLERLFAEAVAEGAELVVFPESFVPCFPVWCLVRAPIDQHKFFELLYRNAVLDGSPAYNRLADIARKYGAYLSVGVTEKGENSMGAMWNTNYIFAPDGSLVGKHRKIMPTWAEKLVHSFGDGSTLKVHDTGIGRLGVLICGENSNTLARFSLLAQKEQIHISTYPPCWPTRRVSPIPGGYNIEAVNHGRAAAHSFEGKVFTIASSGVLDDDAIEQVAEGDAALEAFLRNVARPSTMIVGPDGEYVTEPLRAAEGIIYADLDINKEIALKGVQDITGAYQRFDIFQLHVNQASLEPAYFYTADAAGCRTARRPEGDSESIAGVPDRNIPEFKGAAGGMEDA